jgi:hypothetical protein
MKCPKSGFESSQDTRFCGNCRTKLPPNEEIPPVGTRSSNDKKLDSLLNLQDDILHSIAQALKLRLGPKSVDVVQKDQPNNLEACDYYMKGMRFIKSEYVLTFQEQDF